MRDIIKNNLLFVNNGSSAYGKQILDTIYLNYNQLIDIYMKEFKNNLIEVSANELNNNNISNTTLANSLYTKELIHKYSINDYLFNNFNTNERNTLRMNHLFSIHEDILEKTFY